jgi:hypothetical protein
VIVRKPHAEAIVNIKTNWRASMDDYNNVRVAQLYFYRADDDGNILRDENGNKISYYIENWDFIEAVVEDNLTVDDLRDD